MTSIDDNAGANAVQNSADAYLELRHINKTYGDFHASSDVNISIAKGRLVALLGPSGSGKTTILRMIAGLETPNSGDVIIDGRVVNDVPGSERGIGFVFQSYALFRYMTVFDNIAFGLKIMKRPKDEIKDRVEELLKLINCEGLGKRFPSQLSGGQRQRVAFARALAPAPKLLLLDEPFAAIDAKVRLELRTWLRNTINQLGVTGVFVTHDQDEAIEVADEIVVTNRGRVEQVGTPQELYSSPATPFVAKFIGNSVRVDNYSDFKKFDNLGAETYAIVRPEYVGVYRKGENQYFASSAEKGVVEDLIFRGSNVEVRVRIHGVTISAIRSITETPVAVGEEVDVFVYRVLVVRGDKVVRLDNNALLKESVMI